MTRSEIKAIVEAINPLDELEANHRQDTIDWIESEAPLFRIQKPDVPPKHLVSYFAIVDPKTKKFLLQDHLLAQIWVPAGGHVDPDEDPAETVRRECQEELGINAHFIQNTPTPIFVTVTKTNGQGHHTDVSLWYVLDADESTPLVIEPGKFADV
jgi:8-oxo-dGTP pyrophosphatase MutT (NUDIX family)